MCVEERERRRDRERERGKVELNEKHLRGMERKSHNKARNKEKPLTFLVTSSLTCLTLAVVSIKCASFSCPSPPSDAIGGHQSSLSVY